MYLQLCRTKAYFIVQHTLLHKTFLFNLFLYKTLGGYCTSTSSQVRATESILVRKSRYLYESSLVYFIARAILTIVSDSYNCKRFLQLCAILTNVCHSYNCKWFLQLCTILTHVDKTLQIWFLVCNTPLHHIHMTQCYDISRAFVHI